LRRSDANGWLLVGPAVTLFAVFSVYPMAAGIALSFTTQRGPVSSFAGLRNYVALLTEPELRAGVVNTLLYVLICVPPIVVIPLVIALLGHGLHKVGMFVAFAFYLPGLATGPILALVWRWIFAPDGLVNGWLSVLRVAPVVFLGDIPHAFLTTSFVIVSMNLGGYVILYLVAERNIPRAFYEMAALDGCSPWQQARYVTVPSMVPTVGVVAILATIGMFQVFVVPLQLTGGGPLYSTTSVLLQLYQNAWSYGRLGVAAAEGVVLMLVVGVVSLLQARYVWRAA